MKKNLFKRVLSVAASAALVLIAVPAFPTEVKAASGVKFIQEVKVNDLSDHVHEANIKVPELFFTYFLDPVVDDDELPSSGRYQTIKQNFPAGNSSPDGEYKQLTANLHMSIINNTAGDNNNNSDGKGIVRGEVSLDSAASDAFGSATWAEANKIYRYKLTIQNVSIGAAAGADVRLAGDGLFSGGNGALYCDVDVAQDKTIRNIVLHKSASSTDADDKVEGFTESANLALSYNVYDVVVTSDYIGDTNNYDASKVTYTLSLKNLPSYLNQSDILPVICSGTAGSEYVGENRQNWKPGTAEANTAQFMGTLQSGWHQTFPGIPVVGTGGPVQFNTDMNYNRLSTANDFNSTIYVGGNAAPLAADINTLELFRSWASFGDYANVDNTSVATIDTSNHTATLVADSPVLQSASSDANNIRFVVFDPNTLILVGVVVNALPAIILVGLAGVGGALLFRRKRTE